MGAADLFADICFVSWNDQGKHGQCQPSGSQEIVLHSGRNSEGEMQFFLSREVTKQLLI